MLDPLIELRATWRQSIVVTVPSDADELINIADHALDLLADHSQLDQDGLSMAIQVICNALHTTRPDITVILDDRLSRAVRDYLTEVGVQDRDTDLGSAFDSAIDLADALAAMVGGQWQDDDPADALGTSAPAPPKIDAALMQRSLKKEHRKYQRGRWHFARIVFNVVRIALILLLVAAVVYLILHPSLLTRQVTLPPTTQSSPSPSPTP